MDLRLALEAVFKADTAHIVKKDASYGSSWKKRGGVGAYMMFARKWDRLEQMAQGPEGSYVDILDLATQQEQEQPGDESNVLAQVADLRHYLALFETEVRQRIQQRRLEPQFKILNPNEVTAQGEVPIVRCACGSRDEYTIGVEHSCTAGCGRTFAVEKDHNHLELIPGVTTGPFVRA